MRMFIVNLLAVAALVFSASSAGAVSVIMAGVDGQSLDPGDQFTVTVTLDTEATTGITLLSIGVIFDDTKLTYVKEAEGTQATSYMLYTPSSGTKGAPQNNFLKASSTCGGYPSPGGYYSNSGDCSLRVNTTNQVNLDFVSADFEAGTTEINVGIAEMARLVFEVLPGAEGAAMVELSQTSPGNVIGQPGGGTTTATLLGGGVVNVPEPGVAGLSLAALLTVGGLRARSRMRS